jgi:hypothetical protein
MSNKLFNVVGNVRRKAVSERYCVVVLASSDREAAELAGKYWEKQGCVFTGPIQLSEFSMAETNVIGVRKE